MRLDEVVDEHQVLGKAAAVVADEGRRHHHHVRDAHAHGPAEQRHNLQGQGHAPGDGRIAVGIEGVVRARIVGVAAAVEVLVNPEVIRTPGR